MSENNAHFPLVSIVTPSFNDARFIERTIQSVAQQEYPFLEHIVIDGGSTDGTIEILQRYLKVQWVSEKDNGQSDALNKGFKAAQGEVVGWINSDDTYNPGAVRAAVCYLLSHPSTDMVYSNCNIIGADDKIVRMQHAPVFDLARELIAHNLPQPTIFIRARALQEVGYLNPRLHYIMDWELFLRLGLKSRIDRVNATWANFREANGTKTTSSPEQFWIEAVSMLDEFLSRADLPQRIRLVSDQARARAGWLAGLFHHARPGREAIALGQVYCQESITRYPMLEKDLDFVRTTLTDIALRWSKAQPEVFIDQVLAPLAATKRARSTIMGQLYASRALMKTESRPGERREWLRRAISNDMRWLSNPGILALLLLEQLPEARG